MKLPDLLKTHPISRFKRPIHEENTWFCLLATGDIIQFNETLQLITPANFTALSILADDWFIGDEPPPREALPDNVILLSDIRRKR